MKDQQVQSNLTYKFLPVALIVVAAFSRLIPHWPNFTAIGAMALFAGSVMGFRWIAILIPLFTLLLSDAVLGFHSTMIAVYGAVAVNVLMGAYFLKKQSTKNVLAVSVVAALQFFVVTNFAVWALDSMYTKDMSGLVQAYTMALPFLPQQVAGDIFFSVILFAVHAFATKKISATVGSSL